MVSSLSPLSPEITLFITLPVREPCQHQDTIRSAPHTQPSFPGWWHKEATARSQGGRGMLMPSPSLGDSSKKLAPDCSGTAPCPLSVPENSLSRPQVKHTPVLSIVSDSL